MQTLQAPKVACYALRKTLEYRPLHYNPLLQQLILPDGRYTFYWQVHINQ